MSGLLRRQEGCLLDAEDSIAEAVDPWLPVLAHVLPYRRGLYVRHLGLMRAGGAL